MGLYIQCSWDSIYNVHGTLYTMFMGLYIQCSWDSIYNVHGTLYTMFMGLYIQCSWDSIYNVHGTLYTMEKFVLLPFIPICSAYYCKGNDPVLPIAGHSYQ